MAYYLAKNNWVTFDEEQDGKENKTKANQSLPRNTDGIKSASYLSSSLSSISSAQAISKVVKHFQSEVMR